MNLYDVLKLFKKINTLASILIVRPYYVCYLGSTYKKNSENKASDYKN